MANKERDNSPVHRALIAKALERVHAELGPADLEFADAVGPEELLQEAQALEANARDKSSSTFRLESILAQINDFAAVVALSNGFEPKVTGVVWGSLKIILMLVHRTSDVYEEVLAMLDELSLALPRFRAYAETLQLTNELESGLVDVYTEMTCFCARAVRFFRSSPHNFLVRAGWPQFSGDFKQTLSRLKTLSQIVDREAQAIRLRMDSKKNQELVEALESLKTSSVKNERLPCHCLPNRVDRQFFGRTEDLASMSDHLIAKNHPGIKVVLLHGLGGVGKSTMALRFATTNHHDFDAILWINADEPNKIQHSFLDFAQRLGIISEDDEGSEASLAMTKVKEWLRTSGRTWLMIFDNVDDRQVLEDIWPVDSQGSIIITARNSTVTFGTSALNIQVQPFDASIGREALMHLVGQQSIPQESDSSAAELVQALGGLPLAINQISGFIVQQRMSVADFVKFYDRNAEKVGRHVINPGERAVSAIWEIALSRLPDSSSRLAELLALLDPDGMNEDIMLEIEQAEAGLGDEYDFVGDEMSFMMAKTPLLDNALIERLPKEKCLTMHRLIQTAVISRLKKDERGACFGEAVKLLGAGFPNTWNKVTSHQYAAWTRTEIRVAHVSSLIKKKKQFKIPDNHPKATAELVFRIAWYLYERELYDEAESMIRAGLEISSEKDSLTIAAAMTLRGLIELDTLRLKESLQSFLVGLEIRNRMLSPGDEFIASSLNAISLAHTELNDLDKAITYGQKAIDIRQSTKSDRIGNSYSNMASTLLRAGKANEAEEMLACCPSLKNFTDETFLASGNPRFAGDMVLLSRIRAAQGRLEDAIRLASKALTFRQTTHGNRLKTCDSMQLVASLLEGRGDIDSALYLFKQSASVAESLPYGEGHLARAHHALARIYASSHEDNQSDKCRDVANSARDKVLARRGEVLPGANLEEPGVLTPWMLW